MIATIGRLVCVLDGIEAGVKHESDEKLRKHLKERDKKRLQVKQAEVGGMTMGTRKHSGGVE